MGTARGIGELGWDAERGECGQPRGVGPLCSAVGVPAASGGLVVYTAKPPATATAEEYNRRGAEFAEELLRSTAYENVTIPYRQNRIVVFDSALYHKTDSFRFRGGYENRRINLTLLFGKMRRGDDAPAAGEL